jgi:sec-independent protein translocase protein TatC
VASEDFSPPEKPAEPAPQGTGELRMPVMEHLRELRTRLIRALVAVAVGFTIAYLVSDQLFAVLTWPIREVSHNQVLLIGTGVGEAFFVKLKVALIAGLFIASPAVFYEVWRFIAPGLYRSERKLALPFIVFATAFFILGAYFCWAVVFKAGYKFFLDQYASIGVTPTIRISEYVAFSAKLLLAFAITFEMPIFAYFLTRLGIVDHKMMIHQFRYAILGIFVVAAAFAPPGPVPMFLLAVPLLALYAVSIGVSYVFRQLPAGEPQSAAEHGEAS